MNTPEKASPALRDVLRYYGPWLGALALAVVVLAAYYDLRARVAALEEHAPLARVAADAPESARGRPGAEGSPAVVTQGPPPTWSCGGQLSQDAVREAIGRYGPAVLRCYDQRALQAAGLRGTLLVRVRVSANGAADAVYVTGIEDPPLVSCVGNAAIGWRFPPPAGGQCAVVEAPFALAPH